MRNNLSKLASRLGILASLISVASMSASCKKKTSDRAAIKTLDSIANPGAPLTLHQCKGGNELHPSLVGSPSLENEKIVFDQYDASLSALKPEEKANMRKAVQNYFTALDPAIQKLFLESFGGSITLSSRVNQLCSRSRNLKSLNSQLGEQSEGCFAFATDPKNKKSAILTIIHRINPMKPSEIATIQYYGPLMMGYMYAQFYPRITKSFDPNKLIDISKDVTTPFYNQKTAVANAFLEDLLDGGVSLEPLNELLGSSAKTELNSAIKTKKFVEALTFGIKNDTERTTKRNQVIDYFFAHAFQSMNCDDKTIAIAKDKFNRSFTNFANTNQAILELSSVLSGQPLKKVNSENVKTAKVAASKSSDSLSLGGNPLEMFSSLMPALGGGGSGGGIQGMLAGLMGGAGGGGGGGIGDIFSKFSGMLGGAGGGAGGLGDIFSAGASDAGAGGDLYASLGASGCPGGSCPGGCCGGGSCCGGSCSSCSNGCPGGCCGGCSCGTA